MANSNQLPKFDTDEILWYDNGKWGRAGYAIPNSSGKTWSINAEIHSLVSLLGRNMFELAHREDVRFYGAPHKQFWFDLHQLIVVARKRINDRTRLPNDSNGLVTIHSTPAPQVYLVFPVPYFGERIRQNDVRQYLQYGLMLLGEMMQHGDNEKATTITPQFAGMAGKYLQEILAMFSMKYFGKTRVEAYAPGFALTDADFLAYDPSKVLTSVEMTEERPPLQWWPTENDLSQIRGLPINDALLLAKRWPVGDWLDEADGNVFPDPTAQGTETNTSEQGTAAAGGAPAGGFVAPPGQAP